MQEAPISPDEMTPVEERSMGKEKETPETEMEEETPETPQEENPEETSNEKQPTIEEFKSIDAQKRAYREKYEKAQKELAELKKNTPSDIKIPTSTDPLQVVRLAKALEGYNEDEVSFITRNASNNTIEGIINATKDDWVKTAIQSKRDKINKEKGTPSPTSPSSSMNEKAFELVKDMDKKTYEKHLEAELSKQRVGTRGI